MWLYYFTVYVSYSYICHYLSVRKQYGEELDRRIAEKREELIREKILFYEEVIRKVSF